MRHWPDVLCLSALAAVLGLAVAVHGRANEPGAADAADAAAAGFAIRGARVFDGERDLGVATVVVRDGRIEAVGADVDVPDGYDVVDGGGRTLLPGLIDAHVHAWGDAQRDAARFGVTTALDLHGMVERLPALREQRESLADTGQADLWASGYAVTAPGGHGTQYGFPVPTIDDGTDVDAFIAARIDEGADFIKLIVEDLSTYRTDRSLPTLTGEQVEAVIAAAHARDRLAVAHVSTLEHGRQAVAAGADGLVHIFADAAVDEAFVAAVRERDAFVVPTLSVRASISGGGEGRALAEDPRLQPMLTAEQTASLAARFGGGAGRGDRPDHSIENVRRLHAAGVTILAGTDALNPGTAHGVSMHGELALLVRAGLDPGEALAAATSLPAQRFGLDDRGRIAPGMRADLLLVEGDPLADIAATRAIASVWKNGYRVERDPRAGVVAAAAPEQTLVSDFDGGAIAANFGAWQATADAMAGGASTAGHRLVAGGADGSRGALAVAGEIRAGFPFPWAGVIFFAASEQMQPVDFSARSELVFQVRGDGRSYNAMLFSGASTQGMPSMQAFTAGAEWSQVRLRLSDFEGGDPSQLRAIAFAAGQPEGSFEFFLDHVELR